MGMSLSGGCRAGRGKSVGLRGSWGCKETGAGARYRKLKSVWGSDTQIRVEISPPLCAASPAAHECQARWAQGEWPSSQAPSSHHMYSCLQGRQLLSLLAWTAAHMAWRRRRRYYAPGGGHQGPLKGTPPDWVQYLPSLSARHPLAAHPASVPTTTTTPSACAAPAATPAAAPLHTPCAHFLAPKGYAMGQLECPGLCLSLDAPLPLVVCVGSQCWVLPASNARCRQEIPLPTSLLDCTIFSQQTPLKSRISLAKSRA